MFLEDAGIKMYDDSMVEFLYVEDAKYRWRKLDIAKTKLSCWHNYKIDSEVDNNLMKGEFDIPKNLCLCDNLNYHYHSSNGPGPLLIKIEYFKAAIIKGRHRVRNIYLESHLMGITQALWRVNTELSSKIKKKNRKLNHLLNNMLIHINTGRLLTNKITYFKNLVVCYDNVEKVNYRGKERYCINVRVISRQILLPKEIQYMSESE